MLVSTTKRSLTLPVTSGSTATTNFNAIWNWVYDPVTKAPPSGWSAAWSSNGHYLHVQRLNLANLFVKTTLKNLSYNLGSTNLTATALTSQTNYYFLAGTRLIAGPTNGIPARAYALYRDVNLDFSTTVAGPLLWFKFVETSGTTATNSGTAGSSANGTLTGGPTLNVAGPRSPTNSGYSTGNVAISFDGVNDYINTSYLLPTSLPAFSLAFWYNPPSTFSDEEAVIGVSGVLYLQMRDDRIRMEGPSNRIVDYDYNPPENVWTHLAVTADSSSVKLYRNGTAVYSSSGTLTNYSTTTANTFRMGGNIDSGAYPRIKMDEVLFYNRVLSATEISQVYTNNPP
jgi:hypothetical protein